MVLRQSNLSFADPSISVLQAYKLLRPLVQGAEKLVFIHPPKTAGTNIDYAAQAISQLDPACKTLRLAVPRIAGQSPNLIYPNWIGGLGSATDNIDAIHNATFISGHMPAGLDDLVEADCRYFASIRHPVEREISSLNFDYQRGYINEEDQMDYLKRRMLDNPQTRMLAGMGHFSGACTEDTLKQAFENLDKKFLFAAPYEASFEVIQVLLGQYGIPALGMSKAQVTGLKCMEAPNNRLRSYLEDKHQYDLHLYKEISKRWKLWKMDNLVRIITLDLSATIPVILPDFSHTKTMVPMTISEIVDYNDVAPGLVSTQQKHDGLKAPSPKP